MRDENSVTSQLEQCRSNRLDMTLAIATRMSCTDDKNLADRSFSELMGQSFKVELIEPQPYRMRLTSDNGDVLVFQAKPIPL